MASKLSAPSYYAQKSEERKAAASSSKSSSSSTKSSSSSSGSTTTVKSDLKNSASSSKSSSSSSSLAKKISSAIKDTVSNPDKLKSAVQTGAALAGAATGNAALASSAVKAKTGSSGASSSSSKKSGTSSSPIIKLGVVDGSDGGTGNAKNATVYVPTTSQKSSNTGSGIMSSGTGTKSGSSGLVGSWTPVHTSTKSSLFGSSSMNGYDASKGEYDPNLDYSLAIVQAERMGMSDAYINELKAQRQNKINAQYGGVDPYKGSNTLLTGQSGSENASPSLFSSGYYNKDIDYSKAIVEAEQQGLDQSYINQLRQERQNKINDLYAGTDPYQGSNASLVQGSGSQGLNQYSAAAPIISTEPGQSAYGVTQVDKAEKNSGLTNGYQWSTDAMPDMSRRPDLAGSYAQSGGMIVFYDENGYAAKAVKGNADYTPILDENAKNGTYNTRGAWTDEEMMTAEDFQKVNAIRSQMFNGQISGDEANALANQIRKTYGYSIDKYGYVTNFYVAASVEAQRAALGLDNNFTQGQYDLFSEITPEDDWKLQRVNQAVEEGAVTPIEQAQIQEAAVEPIDFSALLGEAMQPAANAGFSTNADGSMDYSSLVNALGGNGGGNAGGGTTDVQAIWNALGNSGSGSGGSSSGPSWEYITPQSVQMPDLTQYFSQNPNANANTQMITPKRAAALDLNALLGLT